MKSVYRERYMRIAQDGLVRTSSEIAAALGMPGPMCATQFIRALKISLVSEKSEWKVVRLGPEPGSRADKWKLVRRQFDIHQDR